jgi:hypothetical protein
LEKAKKEIEDEALSRVEEKEKEIRKLRRELQET